MITNAGYGTYHWYVGSTDPDLAPYLAAEVTAYAVRLAQADRARARAEADAFCEAMTATHAAEEAAEMADTQPVTPAALYTLDTTGDGIQIVYGSRGYDTADGYLLTCAAVVQTWRAKAAAARVAAALGPRWNAVRASTAPTRRLWVVHAPGGGFLTIYGYRTTAARRAAEHFTRTYTSGHRTVPYRVNSRGMTGYRDDYTTTWCCTCGAGGFGEHRNRWSAQQRAAAHRADPAAHPGTPWNPATVAALRAQRAI